MLELHGLHAGKIKIHLSKFSSQVKTLSETSSREEGLQFPKNVLLPLESKGLDIRR